MDTALIKLGIAATGFVACGAINYASLALADAHPSKIRSAGVVFGWAGILLMVLIFFWPLISLSQYFAGDASGMVKLFDPLLIAAALCTFGSLVVVIVVTRREGREP